MVLFQNCVWWSRPLTKMAAQLYLVLYPSLQSDVGPTSVNGRLWRWFDVECQRWPVVILLIGSTLARLIGSTLQCLISNVGPTSVKGRRWRWFDVECQRWPVVILLIGLTLARLICSKLARRYNVLFPMVSRPISNVQILCISRQDVCPDGMFDRWADVKSV
jgi:uncharacterized membrane protein YhdT